MGPSLILYIHYRRLFFPQTLLAAFKFSNPGISFQTLRPLQLAVMSQWPRGGFLTRSLSLLQPLSAHQSESDPGKPFLSFFSLPSTNQNDREFSSRSKRVILSQRKKTSLIRWVVCLNSTQQSDFHRKSYHQNETKPLNILFVHELGCFSSVPKKNKHITYSTDVVLPSQTQGQCLPIHYVLRAHYVLGISLGPGN